MHILGNHGFRRVFGHLGLDVGSSNTASMIRSQPSAHLIRWFRSGSGSQREAVFLFLGGFLAARDALSKKHRG